MVLSAPASTTAVLARDQQQGIGDPLLRAQQDDGGWSTASMGSWKRADGSALDPRSDGYATGLVTFVLESAVDTRTKPAVTRGRAWLVSHQDPANGAWFAASLNKQRDPTSDAGRFMSD